MEKEGDKIIMRSNRLQGVQKSFNNLEMVSSVRVTVTKLTSKIFKEKGIAYIGTRESLSVGDVIQVGNFSILYKVVKHQSKTDDKGNVYRIKRVDGFNITGLDIDGTEVGQKVIIKNRRSYQDIFNDFGDFNEPPCEPKKDLMCGYEEKECPIIPAANPTPEPEPVPSTWRSTACAYGMYNSLQWVFDSEEFADVPISISSLSINGTEYITPGNEYDIADEPLNIVPANNWWGQTYTNQVDGINALLTSLGLDNLVKAQVVTNDYWATTAIDNGLFGSSPGAFYLILAQSVETFTITFDDNVGWTKTIDIDREIILYNAGGTATNSNLGYEFVTCININEEPFTVNSNGVVEEPPF